MRHVAVFAVWLTLGCSGGFVQKATQTLETTLVATNSARDEFVKWDKQHQLQLVERAQTREDADALLRHYRERRQKIVHGFTIAYGAIATAAATLPLVELGDESQGRLASLLVEAANAVRTAIEAYKMIRDGFDDEPDVALTPSFFLHRPLTAFELAGFCQPNKPKEGPHPLPANLERIPCSDIIRERRCVAPMNFAPWAKSQRIPVQENSLAL